MTNSSAEMGGGKRHGVNIALLTRAKHAREHPDQADRIRATPAHFQSQGRGVTCPELSSPSRLRRLFVTAELGALRTCDAVALERELRTARMRCSVRQSGRRHEEFAAAVDSDLVEHRLQMVLHRVGRDR